MVATIAQIHLHPSVLPKLCAILNWTNTNPNEPECHLAPIASWADRVRRSPGYGWTGPLHYVEGKDDYPSETCAFPGDRGWVNGPVNLLNAIVNVTHTLEEWDGQVEEVGSRTNEALKFLVHFYGDLHMPLHTAGRERGGNGIKVTFDGRHTSECLPLLDESLGLIPMVDLHSLWDSLLIAQRLRTLPRNYTLPLLNRHVEYNLRGTIYDPYVRRVMWEGIFGMWKDEVQQWLSCPSPELSAVGNGGMWQTVLSMFKRNVAAETDDDLICPYAWAKPINAMNCDFIFPKALDEHPFSERYHDPNHAGHAMCAKHEAQSAATDLKEQPPYLELDTPEYSGKIRDEFIVEKLIAQAGIRLAGVLNFLFADEDAGNICGQLWVPTV